MFCIQAADHVSIGIVSRPRKQDIADSCENHLRSHRRKHQTRDLAQDHDHIPSEFLLDPFLFEINLSTSSMVKAFFQK